MSFYHGADSALIYADWRPRLFIVRLRFLVRQHLHQLLLRIPRIQDTHQIVDVARLLLWSVRLAQALVAKRPVALLLPEVPVHHLP